MNTLPREARNGMGELEALLFSLHWEQAEQGLCAPHSRLPASPPHENPPKASWSFLLPRGSRSLGRAPAALRQPRVSSF